MIATFTAFLLATDPAAPEPGVTIERITRRELAEVTLYDLPAGALVTAWAGDGGEPWW